MPPEQFPQSRNRRPQVRRIRQPSRAGLAMHVADVCVEPALYASFDLITAQQPKLDMLVSLLALLKFSGLLLLHRAPVRRVCNRRARMHAQKAVKTQRLVLARECIQILLSKKKHGLRTL